MTELIQTTRHRTYRQENNSMFPAMEISRRVARFSDECANIFLYEKEKEKNNIIRLCVESSPAANRMRFISSIDPQQYIQRREQYLQQYYNTIISFFIFFMVGGKEEMDRYIFPNDKKCLISTSR